jgi:regulator of protease activity HflC (stomatin/prohibitin superfamily)
MRVDLDLGLDLRDLPRFQRASMQVSIAVRLASAAGLMAAALFAVSWLDFFNAAAFWSPLLRNCAATFLLLALGSQSCSWIGRWRAAALAPVPTAWWLQRLRERSASRIAAGQRWWRIAQWIDAAAVGMWRVLRSDLCRSAWSMLIACVVVWLVVSRWNLTIQAPSLGRTGYVAGGITLLVAFALLVQERYFSSFTVAQWPEASLLAQLMRIAIAVLLSMALCLFFAATPRWWVPRVAVLCGLLPAIVAAEIAVRALLALFVRNSERIEPRVLTDSVLASLWRWPPRPLRTLQDQLRSRFGIDLRQSWAFAYMRRATLPVLGAITLIGWLTTGVREVPIEGRGIYERFGKPIAVLQPGVHIGLPWLLATVRPMENGVVHALATTVGTDDEVDMTPSTADGPAPEAANRLWDESHLSENSQIIASASGDRQSFQIVNMDVRFVYRIGLSDAAALAATYRSVDVAALLRTTASRILVRDFASRTLDGVLGEQRLMLAATVRAAVQRDLDAVDSGIEILATLIEAVHPPAGAANAYHSVQAAQIKVHESSARERGRAAQQLNDAWLNAALVQNRSIATAREARSSADVVALRFAAERNAYRRAGNAFLTEQYLTQLSAGLADAKIVLVDHRLRSGQAPTLDLRPFAATDARGQ